MAIGEANGNSSTFTIKITIGYTDTLCGPPVVTQVVIDMLRSDELCCPSTNQVLPLLEQLTP